MTVRTGEPLWPRQDGEAAPYASLSADTSADVAIIGGGVTGALAARALTEAGASVVLLERDRISHGSTAATSGLLLYDTDSSLELLIQRFGEERAVRVYRRGLDAIDAIEAICRQLPVSCGFTRRPSLYLASNDDAVEPLRREHALRRRFGFDSAFLDGPEIAARYSFRAPAAIYESGTAEIDAYRFTEEVLRAAASGGARIFERTRVTGVRSSGSGVHIETADGASVRARLAICCTGYEAAETTSPLPIKKASTWVVVTDPVASFDGWPERCLIWETARPYFYLRTTPDNRVLMGGGDEPGAHLHTDRELLRAKSAHLLDRAQRMFPAMRLAAAGAWAGTFVTTEDGLPFVDEAPGQPNVWFALGYGGNGITFSVMASNILADRYRGRPNADAAMFSFDRAAASSR